METNYSAAQAKQDAYNAAQTKHLCQLDKLMSSIQKCAKEGKSYFLTSEHLINSVVKVLEELGYTVTISEYTQHDGHSSEIYW